jgi:RNA polymerase sigma-70 factor, ECF subfamily
MNDIEGEIINGLKNGNRNIFNIIFKNFYAILVSYAKDLVKSYEAAEEIVQEVFIKLWEHRARIVIQTSLKAYLYKSVYNASLNYLRDIRRKPVRLVNIDDPDYLETLTIDESEWFFISGRLEKMEETLQSAIMHLPDQCRQIFELCRYENLSYPQIAEKLSVSLSTVKTQMGRAMAKLKEAMDKEARE